MSSFTVLQHLRFSGRTTGTTRGLRCNCCLTTKYRHGGHAHRKRTATLQTKTAASRLTNGRRKQRQSVQPLRFVSTKPGQRQKATLAAEDLGSSAAAAANETVSLAQLVRDAQIYLSRVLRKPRTFPIPRWITPKHFQFTFSECFGHMSFVLVAASYAVDDFLWLRCIAVAGSTSMLFFTYFHPHGRVLWLPFKWNVLFIMINSYRIGKVFLNRYHAERLPDELMELRRRSFYLMDPVDFYRLVRIAEIKEYKRGDLVVAEGERVRHVRLVLDGKLRVLREGKLTYELKEANFLSEAGIHAGLMIPGKIESCCAIVADENTRLLCWDRTELIHLMELHEGVRRSLKAILSWDIVRKLKAQRALVAAENKIDNPEEWTARRNRQTQHRYAAILHAILQHPQYLKRFRKEINKYRMIHHIDDDSHAMALAECGWTVEEYEAGKRLRKRLLGDEDDDEDDELARYHDDEERDVHVRDWRWYIQDIYLRFFG